MRDIALIGAMESEIHPYREYAHNVSQVCDGNFTFTSGEMYEKQVVIVCSGHGKVLTALTVQKVIDTYHPKAVIMIGVGGALKADLKLGDIVVSEDCVQHDLDVTALGYPRGTVPDTDFRFIPADQHLISLALKARLDYHKLVTGRVVSGDQFFSEEETYSRDYLFDELEGSVIEMEGASLAQVCAFNGIPFVIIRTICSELAGNQQDQYRASLPYVVNNSLRVVEAILKHLK